MILVDFREGRSMIPTELKRFKIPITMTELDVGDYLVCGKENICVSRKDCVDYVGSLASGHLNNELFDMSTNYPFTIFIYEGFVSKALMYRRLTRQAYISSMVGVALKRSPDGAGGVISFLPAETPFDTAMILKYIHEKVTVEDGLLRTPTLQAVRWKPSERAVGILSAFPNVGKKRATDLLKEFKTLEKICQCTVKEMCVVSGVGTRTATSIFETWRRVYGNKSN